MMGRRGARPDGSSFHGRVLLCLLCAMVFGCPGATKQEGSDKGSREQTPEPPKVEQAPKPEPALKDEMSAPKNFKVRFGVMDPAPGLPGHRKLRPTRIIPMNGEQKPGFSFLIDPPNDESYEFYSVSHLPAAPKELTGEFKAEEGKGESVFRTAPQTAIGTQRFDFGFSPGDPIGAYTLEVYVNDRLVDTIEFQVVKP